MIARTLLLAAALCRLAAGQGFAYSCNARTAQLADGHWLGMYCLNLNTAMYGYNWTWYGCLSPENVMLRRLAERDGALTPVTTQDRSQLVPWQLGGTAVCL